MTWVKVCGITDLAARDAAIEAGADAIGFVVAPRSPRRVTRSEIETMIEGIDVETFIVSTDVVAAEAVRFARDVGATGVQNHGIHAAETAMAGIDAHLVVLRPVAVRDDAVTVEVDVPAGAIPIYDTHGSDGLGGTGRTFRWDALADVRREFVLAGGLGVDNVSRAILTTGAWGVDASSRLETAPGRKDPDTIRAFVKEAKRS